MKGIFGPNNLDPDMAMCKNLRDKVSQVTILHLFFLFRAAIKGVIIIFKAILAFQIPVQEKQQTNSTPKRRQFCL